MDAADIENLTKTNILTFCENLAELGCPRDQEPDMWYRYLTDEQQLDVSKKIKEIEERNFIRFMLKNECRIEEENNED